MGPSQPFAPLSFEDALILNYAAAGAQFVIDAATAPTALEARTLPNGVKNDPYLQRVSVDVILKASDISGIINRAGFAQAVIPFTVFNPSATPPIDAAQGTFLIPGWIEKAESQLGDYIPNLFSTRLSISQALVFDFPLDTTLVQAQALLAGMVVRYQLSTPIDRLNSPLPATTFDTSIVLPNGVRNQPYIKNISDSITLTGNESWFSSSYGGQAHYYLNTGGLCANLSPDVNGVVAESGILPGITQTQGYVNLNEGVWLNNASSQLWVTINPSRLATQDVAGFKAWLAQQVANGTPVKVRYQLFTSVNMMNAPFPTTLVDKGNKVGKNLFDLMAPSGTYDQGVPIALNTGSKLIFTGATTKQYVVQFKINPSTQYTLSFKQPLNQLTFWRVQRSVDKYTFPILSQPKIAETIGVAAPGNRSLTFTTESNANYVLVFFEVSGSGTAEISEFQLEEGNAATAYEPYQKNNALLTGFAGNASSGMARVPVKGVGDALAYTNLVTNGDFSQGTTGWINAAGTISAEDKILNASSTATSFVPTFDTTQVTVAGKRILLKLKARIITTNVTSFDVVLRGTTSATIGTVVAQLISNPTINQWYEVKQIVTLDAGATGNIRLAFRITGTDTNITKIIELDGDYGVLCINLTDNPFVQAVEAKLDRQITVEECDQIFEFTRSVKTVKVALQEFFKLDGVDSRFSLSHPKLNIRGLEDFVMAVTFMTPGVLKDGYIFSQNTLSGSDVAYGLYLYAADKKVILYAAGSGIGSVFVNPNASYRLIVGRVNGKVVFICNEMPVSEWNGVSTAGFITPGPFTMIGARSGASDGSMISVLSDVYLGPLLLFKGADLKTGLSGIMNRIESVFEGYTPDASVSETDVLGVKWGKVASPALTRTDGALGKVAVINGQNDFANHPIFKLIKEVTDKYGNVFVRFPKFYIKKTSVPGELTKQISLTKRPGYYLPWCFYDFQTRRELPYFDIGKHLGSLSEDGLRLESKGGRFPANNKNIVQFRDLAKANGQGYQQLDVHGVDVLQTLFYMMFATLNSQGVMQGYTAGQYSGSHVAVVTGTGVNQIVIANAFADQYRVGQAISIGTSLGGNQIATNRLIVAINVYDGSNKAIVFDGVPVNVAIGNIVYNVGYKTGWSAPLQTGWKEADDGKSPCAFLGVESPYGDIWQLIDGININERQSWVCKNADSYTSNLFTAPYESLGYVNANIDGHAVEMGFDANLPFAEIPKVSAGGSSSTFYSDYYYQSTGQRVARLGGYWKSGVNAGFSDWYLYISSWDSGFDVGARLCRKPTLTELSKPEDIQSYLDDASCKVAISVDRQVRSIQNANAPLRAVLADQAGRAGKNLFDPFGILTKHGVAGSQITFVDGVQVLELVGSYTDKIVMDNFKANTQYTFKIRGRRKEAGIQGGYMFIVYTDDTVANLYQNDTWQTVSLTSTSGKSIRHIKTNAGTSGKSNYYDITVTQFEEGGVATAFEPYGFNNALLQGVAGTAADGYVLKPVRATSGDLVEYENLVVNGDFSQGTTGWSTFASTNSTVGNILTNTADGSSELPRVDRVASQELIVSKRYYQCVTARVLDAGCLYFRTRMFNSDNPDLLISNPLQNTWYKIKGIRIFNNVSNPVIYITHSYTDAANANGKRLEIKELFSVNLTDNPFIQRLEAKLGRQLTADECDILFTFTPSKTQFYAKLAWFLKFNGTNAVGIMQNVPDVDIVGTHDFAISTVFMTPAVLSTSPIVVKALSGYTNLQYRVLIAGNGSVSIEWNGKTISLTGTGTVVPNMLYTLNIFRISGVLFAKLNAATVYNLANTEILITQPNVRLGALPSNDAGTTHLTFSNLYQATLAIFYNGAAGLDITKVEKAVAKLNEPYL